MPELVVRFTDDFFDDLERQLPAERTSTGVPLDDEERPRHRCVRR